MSTQDSSNESIMLDTPEQIRMYGMLQLVARLSIEIKTGMKFSGGSSLKTVQQQGWTTKRTKRGALVDLVKVIQKENPDYTPGASVRAALAKP